MHLEKHTLLFSADWWNSECVISHISGFLFHLCFPLFTLSRSITCLLQCHMVWRGYKVLDCSEIMPSSSRQKRGEHFLKINYRNVIPDVTGCYTMTKDFSVSFDRHLCTIVRSKTEVWLPQKYRIKGLSCHIKGTCYSHLTLRQKFTAMGGAGISNAFIIPVKGLLMHTC